MRADGYSNVTSSVNWRSDSGSEIYNKRAKSAFIAIKSVKHNSTATLFETIMEVSAVFRAEPLTTAHNYFP